MKNVAILGSTGSVGMNTLDVIRGLPSINVYSLAACKSVDRLERQVREFKAKIACLMDESKAEELKRRVAKDGVEVVSGLDGLIRVATCKEVDLVVLAVVGGVGLIPLIEAIKAKKDIAIANKEPLVMAGELIMDLASKNGVNILPIDSEHSGIFQCLRGHKINDVSKIILTASGGPLLGRSIEDMEKVSPKEALNHPKWDMGKKISVDSATMMNKGLEVIEAHHLFGIEVAKISILIHPESIIHSLVEFIDGSVIAQLSITDMRLPVSYALGYPERRPTNLPRLDLAQIGRLNFKEPDLKSFPCLFLALEAGRIGGTMPTVLSAANEVAVRLFLEERISLIKIPRLIEAAMESHRVIANPDLDEILKTDAWARKMVLRSLC